MNQITDFFRWARWHYCLNLKLFFQKYPKKYRFLKAMHLRSLFCNPIKEYRSHLKQVEAIDDLTRDCNPE